MGTIIKFRDKTADKFDFKRVKRRKKHVDLEKYGQLNLFSPEQKEARVIKLQSDLSLFEQALRLDETDDPQVKKAYEAAINSGDSVADAYCNLGVLEFKDGNITKAIDCFTNCLKLDPRHFEAHYNLANLYSDVEDLKLAKVHYQFAAEIEPTFPGVFYNLGLVLAMSKEIKPAIEAFNRFKELAPEEKSRNVDELLASLKKSLTL